MTLLQAMRAELRPLAQIALPLVVLRLGTVTMGFVDGWYAGRLGGDALGTLSLAIAVYVIAVLFAQGTLAGVEPIASQAVGAGDRQAQRRSLAGVLLAGVALLPVFVAVLFAGGWVLERLGQPAHLLEPTRRYLAVVAAGFPAGVVYWACSSWLTAIGRTRVFVGITLLAATLNVVLNHALVTGAWGAPALGVTGISVATACSMWFQCAALLVLARRELRLGALVCEVDPAAVRRSTGPVLRLGLPLGVQYGLESGAFSLTTVMVGMTGALALAAHQVAMNVIAVTFTISLALSAAGSARVGHAVGRRDPDGARVSALTVWAVGLLLAGVGAALMVAFREPYAQWFVDDPPVAELATVFILVAAVFQLADVTQAIGFGVLRGFGDTAFPALFNIAGFWLLGLPIGAFAVFHRGAHPVWLWIGLSIGLYLVAMGLMLRFVRNLRALRDGRIGPLGSAGGR